MNKDDLQTLVDRYEVLIQDEKSFRNPIMIEDEYGGLPSKPHTVDAIRSVEREYVYKQFIGELKNLIE